MNGSCERRGGGEDPSPEACFPAMNEYGVFGANPYAREAGFSSPC